MGSERDRGEEDEEWAYLFFFKRFLYISPSADSLLRIYPNQKINYIFLFFLRNYLTTLKLIIRNNPHSYSERIQTPTDVSSPPGDVHLHQVCSKSFIFFIDCSSIGLSSSSKSFIFFIDCVFSFRTGTGDVKGKAAIDVVCNPLGKSGGALIQQFMILTFGSLANSTPYLGGILLVIVLAWLAAARSLDTQFTALRREEEIEKEMERTSVKIPVVSSNEGGDDNKSLGSSTETSYPTNS
ncbi:putative ADP/ATP carrier protein, bacteria [Helianthus anomalus]